MKLLNMLNPLWWLWQLLSALIVLGFLGWFGITCLKLGWYANDNPFWNPIVATVLRVNQDDKENKNLLEQAMDLIPGNDKEGGKTNE